MDGPAGFDTTSVEGWLGALAAELGVDPPSAADVDALLDLAGHAAHRSERRAAPLACWMAGVAGRDPSEVLALVAADPRLRDPDEPAPSDEPGSAPGTVGGGDEPPPEGAAAQDDTAGGS